MISPSSLLRTSSRSLHAIAKVAPFHVLTIPSSPSAVPIRLSGSSICSVKCVSGGDMRGSWSQWRAWCRELYICGTPHYFSSFSPASVHFLPNFPLYSLQLLALSFPYQRMIRERSPSHTPPPQSQHVKI